jgi:DHA2 family methylenomycin A resistance protein-like MFS transporter
MCRWACWPSSGAAAAGGTGAPAARLSLLSHALGVLALAGLSFVLIEGPVLGWLSPGVLAAALTAASALLLLRRERRGSHPLLPRACFTAAAWRGQWRGFPDQFRVFGQLFLLSLFLQQRAARMPCSRACACCP